MQSCTVTMEISMAAPRVAGSGTTSGSILGHVPKECFKLSQKYLLTCVHHCANDNRKQPRGPSKGKWIKTIWYLYVMGYYLASTNNKNK